MALETELPSNYKTWYDLYQVAKQHKDKRIVFIPVHNRPKLGLFMNYPVPGCRILEFDFVYIEQKLLEELLQFKEDSLKPENNLNQSELRYLIDVLQDKLPSSEIHVPLLKKIEKWFWGIIEKEREERCKNNSF